MYFINHWIPAFAGMTQVVEWRLEQEGDDGVPRETLIQSEFPWLYTALPESKNLSEIEHA